MAAWTWAMTRPPARRRLGQVVEVDRARGVAVAAERRVAEVDGLAPGQLEDLVGDGQLAVLCERLAGLDEQRRTRCRSSGRQDGGGPPKEVGRSPACRRGRRRVGPAAARRSARADPELDAVLVERPELGQVAVGLLEVVAEDLLELELAVRVRVDPRRPTRRIARGGWRARA